MDLVDRRPGHGVTVTRRLRDVAEASPDAVFVADARTVWAHSYPTLTFADISDQADRLAHVLRQLGVGPDDAVHVQLPNCPEFLVTLFAVGRVGAVLVPTSPSATPDDVAYVASHADCRTSIVDVDRYDAVAAARDMCPELASVLVVGGRADDALGFADVIASADGAPALDMASESALAAVLYTSGTTGWPKGVMITHRNLVFAGEAVAGQLRIRPDDRWLVSLPMSHMNALGYSAMSALSAGASIVLLDQFVPVEWADTARRSGATLASLFAVHARQLLSDLPAPVVTALRNLVFAQHLTHDERDGLRRLTGAAPLQVYGMTETIAPTIADPLDGPQRPDTIGRLSVWASAKVIDRTGRSVPDGMAGELVVGGEPGRSLMAGYWRRPDETSLVMRDGWLRTGDRVVREEDGFFRFLGRSVEVIKPGADNVSAPEVERVLLEHVSVQDAAVIGVKDGAGDELIVAFVVLDSSDDATPAEIITWSRDRLADYKVPHQVIYLDELPRNSVGKVQRRDLQRLATAGAENGMSVYSAR